MNSRFIIANLNQHVTNCLYMFKFIYPFFVRLSSQFWVCTGPLSKSNSFNAVCLKSKERSVDDIPHKKKTHHEYTDPLDGANRHIARSMSLRPVHLGRPNAGEPKVIMISPKSSHAPEMKGIKKKEHLSYERNKSIRDERASSISRSLPSALDTNRKTITSEDGFESTDLNSRYPKATQLDEKLAPLTKLTTHATRSALDMPGLKMPLSLVLIELWGV